MDTYELTQTLILLFLQNLAFFSSFKGLSPRLNKRWYLSSLQDEKNVNSDTVVRGSLSSNRAWTRKL